MIEIVNDATGLLSLRVQSEARLASSESLS